MNLSDLLGASKAMSVPKPTGSSPNSDTARVGDGFQSSVDSLAQQPDASGQEPVQQTPQHSEAADHQPETLSDHDAKPDEQANGTHREGTEAGDAGTKGKDAPKSALVALSVVRSDDPLSQTHVTLVNKSSVQPGITEGKLGTPKGTAGANTQVAQATDLLSAEEAEASKTQQASQKPETSNPKAVSEAILTSHPNAKSMADQHQTTTQKSPLGGRDSAVDTSERSGVTVKSNEAQRADTASSPQSAAATKTAPSALDNLDAQQDSESDLSGDEPDVELRRSDRRNLIAEMDQKADAKRAEAVPSSTQPGTLDAKIQTRAAGSPGTITDFGQTVSTAQGSNTNPTLREGSVDRMASVTPAQATTDATSRNVITQIAAAVRNKPLIQMVELSLDPPELGRISIQMEVAEIGLKATLSAERSGTGDLIRRQAELLQEQLNDAGFSDVNLEFSDFGADQQPGQETPEQTGAAWGAELPDKLTSAPIVAGSRRSALNSGMDVRL